MPDDTSKKTKEEKFSKLVELGILDKNPLDENPRPARKDDSESESSLPLPISETP